ncbi:MAG: imidazole glycerol phosphate synthase subunit HisH [Anaerolineae bacterium]|nr:imidazole glycerol phosphate synthase subunit HisH [Anaerolineae bacterium]
MIAIVDYGIGNLRSVEKAFLHVGADALVTADPAVAAAAEAIVLPGVGAFGDGMAQLRGSGFIAVLEEAAASGRPILGICLGMQLLFEESEEMGRHAGLGLLPGRVRRFAPGLKVPHIGWNQVHVVRPSALLEGLAQDSYAYFVHSYFVDPGDERTVLATTNYGRPFASVVGRGQIFGLQFHPEKSQEVGLHVLRNFWGLVAERRSGR